MTIEPPLIQEEGRKLLMVVSEKIYYKNATKMNIGQVLVMTLLNNH